MSKSTICLCLLCFFALMSGCSAPATNLADQAQSSAHGKTATDLTDALLKGDTSSMISQMTDAMKGVLTPEKVKEIESGIAQKYGALKSIGDQKFKTLDGMDAVYTTCTFEKGTLVTKTVFDKSNQIAGFWIVAPGQD